MVVGRVFFVFGGSVTGWPIRRLVRGGRIESGMLALIFFFVGDTGSEV